MLYYLKYTHHEIEKLHDLLEFFFNKVEKENPSKFNSTLLFPDWYQNTPNKLRDLENSLEEFLCFDKTIKLKIIDAFRKANEIPELFSDDTKSIPVAKDFECYPWKNINNKEKSQALSIGNFLDDLFVKLYTNQLSKRLTDGSNAPFPVKINSDIHDHYLQHRKENEESKGFPLTLCPFCGLEYFKMPNSEGRLDYDHILPKGNLLYVFSAVNLKNLVPIGSICNSKKGTANLLYSDEQRTSRTIAFYPYDITSKDPFEVISITLQCNKIPRFRAKGEWSVLISPKDNTDLILEKKITTWNRVFKIQDRYAEHLQKDYYWIDSITSELTSVADAQEKLKAAYSDIKLSSSLIANEAGIMLKQAFYKWALDSPDFLPSFINAQQLIHNQNLSVNLGDLV